MHGIHLDPTRPFGVVEGDTDFPSLLSALNEILPEGCTLYFEGGSPSGKLMDFLQTQAVPERAHVAYGTIWPRPRVFHVPARPDTLATLSELARSCAYPELAIHFHVYRQHAVLLEWHDAFTQPMLLSGELAEWQARDLADRLGMSCKAGIPEHHTPSAVFSATQNDNPGKTEGRQA